MVYLSNVRFSSRRGSSLRLWMKYMMVDVQDNIYSKIRDEFYSPPCQVSKESKHQLIFSYQANFEIPA